MAVNSLNDNYFKQLITDRMLHYTSLNPLPEKFKQDILDSTEKYMKEEATIFKLNIKERREKPEIKYQRHALYVSYGAIIISLIAVVISFINK